MTLELHLEGTALDAGVARRAVMQFVGDEGSVDFVRDALLLTSELVSNAALYAPGSGSLTARLARDALRVEVSDCSPVLPNLTVAADLPDVGGRGLQIVENLATSWGAHPTDQGKTVWFELALR